MEKFNTEKPQEKKVETKKEVIQPEVEALPRAEIISMRNEYESQLIQKDPKVRQLEAVISNAVKVLGGGQGQAVSIIPVSNDAVALWQSKLGGGLAGRIFKFLSENSGR